MAQEDQSFGWICTRNNTSLFQKIENRILKPSAHNIEGDRRGEKLHQKNKEKKKKKEKKKI
jgi:hypothetical protein